MKESENLDVRRSVRLAITCGALSGVLLTSTAVMAAQNQNEPTSSASIPAPSTQKLKAVEVTGTKIERTDVEQSQPIQIVTAAQIQAAGLATVGDVLQQITSSGSALNAVSDYSGNATYIATGATTVNLRYLGSNRTLVLVNGHRWATALDGTVDLSTIPSSIIDHIEILQDGASAIYGSEAISGVVNIITVKNLSGAEVHGYVGMYNGDGHWDGLTTNDSITLGSSGEHSGFVFSASYMNQNGIFAGDRTISKEPFYGTGVTRGSSSIPQGRFLFTAPYSGSPSSPSNVIAPSTGLSQADCPTKNFGTASAPEYLPLCNVMITPGTTGTSPADYQPFTPEEEYNYAPLNYLLTPQQTTGIYASGHYDIADNVTLSMTGTANQRVSAQQAAQDALGIGSADNVTFNPGDQYYPFNFPLSTHSLPQDGLLESIGRRLVEFGPRHYTMTNNLLYLNAQLSGFFDVGAAEWDWDAGYAFSRNNLLVDFVGIPNNSYLDIQLNPTLCPQFSEAGCVPINFFGGQSNPMTPEQIAFSNYTSQNSIVTKMQNAYFDITNSDIINLPAGPLGFAAGYQRIANGGSYQPDQPAVHPLTQATPVLPTSGNTGDEAIYAEFDIPLLADVPLARLVDLDVASRYTRDTVAGKEAATNTSSRAGIKWQPIHDLLVRGSWSQGFRTADVSELFEAATSASVIGNDPCSSYTAPGVPSGVQQRCAAQGVPPSFSQINDVIPVLSAGNPHLKPERSISKTIGFVYSPSFLQGFNANLDYYHIKLVDSIQAIDGQTILNGCYLQGIDAYCGDITRTAATGALFEINNPIINIGGTITSGFDWGFTYAVPSTSIGNFEVGLQATYINEYQQFLPNATGTGFVFQNFLGRERGGIAYPLGVPRWKANANLTWTRGNWLVGWKLQYIGSMKESCSDRLDNTPKSLTNLGLCSEPNYQNNSLSQNYLGQVLYHDVRVSYTFSPINTTLTFGVNNIFDKQPASSNLAEQNSFDPTLYRIPGRFYYATVGVKF